MRDHWRLGVVERSVLEALAGAGAAPDRPHRKCANVVDRLEKEFGISPTFGYDALCALSRPWLLHLPLVDFHGNLGSPDARDHPAAPRYTEARLSWAGAIALAAEQGSGPKAPIGLINGDLDRNGSAAPYAPGRIVEALLALVDEPRITDRELVDRIGLPATPTGCEIRCDHIALAAGEATEMVSTARITIEPGPRGDVIVLTNLPLGISAETVGEALAARVTAGHRRAELRSGSEFGDLGLPLRDLLDLSRGDVTRIVCTPQPGADLDDVVQQIAATWGVYTRGYVQLPAPLPELVRDLDDDGDAAAQRAMLTRLLGPTSD